MHSSKVMRPSMDEVLKTLQDIQIQSAGENDFGTECQPTWMDFILNFPLLQVDFFHYFGWE
jgi:hypothetical protein